MGRTLGAAPGHSARSQTCKCTTLTGSERLARSFAGLGGPPCLTGVPGAVLIEGLIRTYISLNDTLSSGWTSIAIGPLFFVLIGLPPLTAFFDTRRLGGLA